MTGSEGRIVAAPLPSRVSLTQMTIALGKRMAGYDAGDREWTRLDDDAAFVAASGAGMYRIEGDAWVLTDPEVMGQSLFDVKKRIADITQQEQQHEKWSLQPTVPPSVQAAHARVLMELLNLKIELQRELERRRTLDRVQEEL